MSPEESFEALRGALEQAGIRYAVGGSWASTAFGDPRFTNDEAEKSGRSTEADYLEGRWRRKIFAEGWGGIANSLVGVGTADFVRTW